MRFSAASCGARCRDRCGTDLGLHAEHATDKPRETHENNARETLRRASIKSRQAGYQKLASSTAQLIHSSQTGVGSILRFEPGGVKLRRNGSECASGKSNPYLFDIRITVALKCSYYLGHSRHVNNELCLQRIGLTERAIELDERHPLQIRIKVLCKQMYTSKTATRSDLEGWNARRLRSQIHASMVLTCTENGW